MRARLCCIAAVGQSADRPGQFVIGRNGDMPWHIPEDLKHFRRKTMGKPILMGRNTYQSLGRPLPGRANLVVSRTLAAGETAGDLQLFADLDQAVGRGLQLAEHGEGELMVIGGAQLYRQLLPRAHRLYLTWIEAQYAGDTFFPALSPHRWQQSEHRCEQTAQGIRLRFCSYTAKISSRL